MAEKKVMGILERTRKSLTKDLAGAKKSLTEFKDRTAVLAKRAKEEAGKTVRISRLKLETIPLVQSRERKLKELGKKTYPLVKSGKISEKGLKSLSEEIKNLEVKIQKKEKEIKQVRK